MTKEELYTKGVRADSTIGNNYFICECCGHWVTVVFILYILDLYLSLYISWILLDLLQKNQK